MPVRYQIDPDNRVVLTVFRDSITLNDFVSNGAKLAIDPMFQPEFGELMEFTEGTSMDLSYPDLKAVLDHDPFSIASHRAIVVHSQGVLYCTARMYQLFRDDAANVAIFSSKTDALSWLVGSWTTVRLRNY